MKTKYLLITLSSLVFLGCSTNTATTPSSSSENIMAPKGYGIIYIGGKAWLDRNLGASRVALSATDSKAYGDLYQWGRKADGHQKRHSATTNKPVNSLSVPHAKFITASDFSDGSKPPRSWVKSANTSKLWSASGSSHNGVCPKGWSIPTDKDFEDLDIKNVADGFKKLKLTAGGVRTNSSGEIKQKNTHGYYWTSDSCKDNKGEIPHNMRLAPKTSDRRRNNIAAGLSVRCVKH